MKNAFAFFQLIRFKNLLIIIGSQFLIKFILIPKFITISNLSLFQFFLLVLSTVTIASAGYIINDISDYKTDLINKKARVVIEHQISKKVAFKWYYFLNFVGVISGGFISVILDRPILSIYFIVSVSLLYAYSKRLKSTILIGNILVAVLTGGSVLIVGLFDISNYNSEVFQTILTYSFFAFGINLIREIVKDIEDVNGDSKVKLKTLPIVFGRKRANKMVFFLSSIFAIAVVILLVFIESNEYILKIYILIGVLLPMLYFISKLQTAKSKNDYSRLSIILKRIMLLGMLTVFFIKI